MERQPAEKELEVSGTLLLGGVEGSLPVVGEVVVCETAGGQEGWSMLVKLYVQGCLEV